MKRVSDRFTFHLTGDVKCVEILYNAIFHKNKERTHYTMTNTLSNSMTGIIPERNISFNGGDLSSDTGAMLLLDFLFFNKLLMDYSDLPYSDERKTHLDHNSNFSLLTQQVVKYLLGYNTQADQDVLKQDPLISLYLKDISSQSSISRLYQRISEKTNNGFWRSHMNQSCEFIHKNQEDILLDADSTKTDTYGDQEESKWISHYKQKGYHPLVVNEYATKILMAAFLRPGNTYSSDESEAVMNEILKRIPDQTPAGKTRNIMFRGDAAFYISILMDLFEDRSNPVRYAIRAKGTDKLEEACINAYYESEHKDDQNYTYSRPFYGKISYQMSGSDKKRIVCFKIFFTEDKKDENKDEQIQLLLIPQVFAVITNFEDMTPEQVISFYCQRGNSENYTKDLKSDFFANTLSHKSFEANTFEFFLKCLAYNLFRFFQHRVMEGSDQNMTACSFRKKYQKVASRLSYHARSYHLKIASSFRYPKKFMRYLRKARTVRWIPEPT